MQEKAKVSDSGIIRFLKLLLKLAVTVICLWYVSTKINLADVKEALQTTRWLFLGLSLLVFVLAKMVASYRLNINFRNINLRITEKENLKLFWLGMFYNLFLPGSVTGDAYKVILLSRRFKLSYKKTTSAVVLDRFSGLLGLGIVLALSSFFVLPHLWQPVLLSLGALAAVGIAYFIVKRFLSDFLPGFRSTFFLGLLVQCLMVLCIYAILQALQIPAQKADYIFIFLVATVASVLPLTVGGGLGIREFVFYQGALLFGVNEHTAVIVSLLFYLITLLTSLFGAIYIFRNVFGKERGQ